MLLNTTALARHAGKVSLLAICLSAVGCAGRAELFPNPDPALRKTAAEFAADAAKRHPYPTDAPTVEEVSARAEIDYMLDRLRVVNFTGESWDDAELWVNRQYVVHVPTWPGEERAGLKSIPFQALYNDAGQSFPTNNRGGDTLVHRIEVLHNGTLHNVPLQLAE